MNEGTVMKKRQVICTSCDRRQSWHVKLDSLPPEQNSKHTYLTTKIMLFSPHIWVFHQWLSGRESVCSAGDMQGTQVHSLVQEDLLKKEMATHSSILAWKIPWMEEPGRQSMGLQRVGHNWATSLSLSFHSASSWACGEHHTEIKCMSVHSWEGTVIPAVCLHTAWVTIVKL